jgi:predicted Fe-Mo cluster-binding NifX family protein
MKILVSSSGPDERSAVDPRFGRAPYFVMVDSALGQWEGCANPAADLPQGAGIEAARFAIDNRVDTVITGATGPNAYKTLSAADIAVFTVAGGLVCEAVDKLKEDALPRSSGASAEPHAGLGGRRSG